VVVIFSNISGTGSSRLINCNQVHTHNFSHLITETSLVTNYCIAGIGCGATFSQQASPRKQLYIIIISIIIINIQHTILGDFFCMTH